MSTPGIIGLSAVAVLVVSWLYVSFTPASPRRTIVEWLATMSMYTALLSLFVNLFLNARADDSTVGMVAFGFLCGLFGGGLIISSYQTLMSLRTPKKTQASATN